MISSHVTIQIDTNRILKNVRDIRALLPSNAQFFAILKADAYGLGAVSVARTLCGVASRIGVVTVSEAMALIAAGCGPLLLLSEPLPTEDISSLIRHDVSFSVYTSDFLMRLSGLAAQMQVSVNVHLKVETGLNRLGCQPEQVPLLLQSLREAPGLCLTGVFTHLGFADTVGHPENTRQLQIFDSICRDIQALGFVDVARHALSSAGVGHLPHGVYDAVRIGLGLYTGAVTIVAPVGHIQSVRAGEWVSYGGLYHAPCDHDVAIVYGGYSAGIPSHTRGLYVGIRGQRYPLIGKVCMDLIAVALPAEHRVKVGDSVLLYGTSMGVSVTADEWFSAADLGPREIFCRFGYRAQHCVC